MTNFQDPETVLTVNNVPVRILHMNTVTSEGKTCIVLDDSDTIPVVTISAPRSVVDALSSDNVIATADVEKMEADNMVPIDITTNKYSDSIKSITSSIRYVRLSIEDESTATFNIDMSVKGRVADGSQIGQITLEQNQVRVTGPASEVALVSSAGVVVDVSGTENNISTNAEIHLYDAEGNDIRLDKNLSLNIDKTMVRVELLTLKQIPVKIAVSGTPAEGFRLTGETSVEPGRITIAAKKGVLDSVSAVSIPSAELNVTAETPPAYIWHTANDDLVPVENSLILAWALSRCGVPFELHIFPEGPHGIGLAPDFPDARHWPGECARFIKGICK